MKLSEIAYRNIFRNRRRSVLSGVAIAVATLTISFMFAIIAGMEADLRYNIQTYLTGAVEIKNSQYTEYEHLNPLHFNIPDAAELTHVLEQRPEVTHVVPRIEFPGAIYVGEEDFRGLGLGVDMERERGYQELDSRLVSGSIPAAGSEEALIGVGLADKLGVDVGGEFTVLTQTQTRGSNAMTFTVSGLVSFPLSGLNESHFMVPIERAQRLLRMPEAATAVLAKISDGADPGTAAASINELLTERYGADSPIAARPWTEIGTSYSFVQIAKISYTLIALLFFVLGSTVIVNTTMMVIYERMREIGTLSALGMSGSELVRMFLLEALFIGVAGAAAGTLAGIGITIPLEQIGLDFSASMEGIDFEMSNVLYPKLSWSSTLFVFVYSVAVALLASLIPSRRAARIEPVEALRDL